MNETAEAKSDMEQAVRIFEKMPTEGTSLCVSAVRLGEAYFHEGNSEVSQACYQKALDEIFRFYGENEYYQVTKRNLKLSRSAGEDGRRPRS